MATFSERLGSTLKAAVGVFSSNSETVAHGLLSGINPGDNGDPTPRGVGFTLDSYSTMPWLRAVAGRIGDAVASTEWQLFVARKESDGQKSYYRDHRLQRADATQRKTLIGSRLQDGDLVQIDDHILLDAIHNSNEFLTGHATRKITQVHLDLVGEAFWVKERNGVGTPVGFWPIPAHWILSTPTASNRMFRVSFKAWQGEIPDTEILWFAEPNPANPYGRGTGIAKSLGDELETDEYMAKMTKQLFVNRARPDFIVFPEQGEMGETLRRRQQAEWTQQHQGFWRAFRPMFASRKIGIHEFQQDLGKLQFKDLRAMERDIIIQVFGMPPELLGVIENANRATVQAAAHFFALFVQMPRLEFMRNILQERLIPEYDERLIIDYVSPIEADHEHQLNVMKAAPWAFTIDQWLQAGGKSALPDDKGQVNMIPIRLVPIREHDFDDMPPPPGKDQPNSDERDDDLSNETPGSEQTGKE